MVSKGFLVPIVIFIVLLLFGAYVYHKLENWRYLDSLYFTVVTATTVGYGDLTPETDAGKIFTIFFAFSGIGMALYFFSMLGKYLFKKQLREKLISEGRIKFNKGIRKVKLR